MDSAKASSLLRTFKSKKKLQIESDPDSASGAPSTDPWSSKTPEKSIAAPRRTRNRSAAFSLKDIRQAAQKLRKPVPTPPTDKSLSSVKSDLASASECSSAKAKKPVNPVELPEKYKLLDEFFRRMVCSIRLLQLRGSSTTFTNISPKVECLSDRRFTYNHLAQLKFLLPEAIEIKKMLVLDERTSCMKPDLHITLNANGVEVDEKLKIFHSRILDFVKSHPEGDDIPEAALPGTFGASKQELLTNSSSPAKPQLMDETPISSMHKPPAAVSHLSQSFRKSFSHRASKSKADITPKLLSTQSCTTRFSTHRVCSATLPPTPLPENPLESTKGEDCLSMEGEDCLSTKDEDCLSTKGEDCLSLLSTKCTPAKLASTPAKLMASTPAIQPPKRCYMSPDGESTESPIKLARRPPPNRSLTFDTPVKSSKVTEDDEIFDILPEDLLQSIREKEQMALEENDPAISQAKWRKKMISSLPKFFDMIYFLFQSMKRSVITKEELVHKVISSNLDIADKREIEEQLRLLQEIAPEWISEKLSSSGDLLLRVSTVSNAESIRRRIAEAK